MLPVLIVNRAHMADRGWPKRADLLGPTSLPFDQEIDNTALAHVALHPRCPRITVRAVDSQADTQGVHDAAERLQRLKQVWSLGHPAFAVWAGEHEQPVPAAATGGQRPPLFASAGPHQDQMILSHDQHGRRAVLGELPPFHTHAADHDSAPTVLTVSYALKITVSSCVVIGRVGAHATHYVGADRRWLVASPPALQLIDDILRSKGLAPCASTDGRKSGEDLITSSHRQSLHHVGPDATARSICRIRSGHGFQHE